MLSAAIVWQLMEMEFGVRNLVRVEKITDRHTGRKRKVPLIGAQLNAIAMTGRLGWQGQNRVILYYRIDSDSLNTAVFFLLYKAFQ